MKRSKNKKVLVLFSRLSDYMLNVFVNHVNNNDMRFHVVIKKPDLSEAPFQFNLNYGNIDFYDQEDFDKNQLLDFVNRLEPDLIICSGWSNSIYNHIVNKKNKKIDCILTMDNQWNGKFKQYLGLFYSRLFIVSKYKKIWVPGIPQINYAKKLGFRNEKIMSGWYVANKNNFINENTITAVKKRFVFVGRYIEIKGIRDICQAFISLDETYENDWELYCIGTGPLKEFLPKHSRIHHLGFLQPKELKVFSKETAVFVLPSYFEPWGLVVQEFALAGFPLIVSDSVGAASQFVDENNGIIFKSKNTKSLKEAMRSFITKNNNQLLAMSVVSIEKAQKVNQKDWSDNLNKLLN